MGRRGERAAAGHLRRKRYRLLRRNYRCPAGEIDLICSDQNTIVFVEVKTRTDERAAELSEALRPPQRQRMEHAAKYFLAERRIHDRPCRFDVVTVLWPPRGAPRIEHFEDAFQARRG